MFVQQLTNSGRITAHKVSADDNPADLGTGVLPMTTVHKHMKTLGFVRDVDSGPLMKIVNVVRDGDSGQLTKTLCYVQGGDSDRVQVNSITCERSERSCLQMFVAKRAMSVVSIFVRRATSSLASALRSGARVSAGPRKEWFVC